MTRGADARPLSAVVAMTPDGVIGVDGDMPWRLKSDLRRFKSLTMGGWLIMGRKTFDSIGRPLPGRQTLVLTRDPDWSSPGVVVAHDPVVAMQMTQTAPAFVVGGAEIYRLLWSYCETVYLTRVWASVPGDTRLDVDWDGFSVCSQQRLASGPVDDYPTDFVVLRRQNSPGIVGESVL